MKNKAEVRDEFHNMAIYFNGVEYARLLMEQYDKIMGGGVEVFEVEGWRDARYVLTPREDGKWDWVFEDPIEGPEYGGVFDSRRDAMYSMAKDADDTLMLDTGIGTRIREAI